MLLKIENMIFDRKSILLRPFFSEIKRKQSSYDMAGRNINVTYTTQPSPCNQCYVYTRYCIEISYLSHQFDSYIKLPCGVTVSKFLSSNYVTTQKCQVKRIEQKK